MAVEWTTIIDRMTPEEAEVFDAAVNAAGAKFRWRILKTKFVTSEDADYPLLEAAMKDAYGEARAAELLA